MTSAVFTAKAKRKKAKNVTSNVAVGVGGSCEHDDGDRRSVATDQVSVIIPEGIRGEYVRQRM